MQVDEAIAWIATTQLGNITRAQLVELGLKRGAIEHRLRTRKLIHWYWCVYRVGDAAAAPEADALAAVLACGDGAVLWGRSAGALWAIVSEWPKRPEVALPRRCELDGISTIAMEIPTEDRTLQRRVPVTTAARGAFDLASLVERRELTRAVNEVQVLGLADRAELLAVLERMRGRAGAPAFAAALGQTDDAPTRSPAEDELWALLERSGLLMPLRNRRIEGWSWDFAWPDRRLVVEVDTYTFHGTHWAYERDRRKTAALEAAGWRVLRVTRRQIERAPLEVVARVATALAVAA